MPISTTTHPIPRRIIGAPALRFTAPRRQSRCSYCRRGHRGTIAGTGKYWKEQNEAIQVVGIDPVVHFTTTYSGVMTKPYTYVLEGIGEDFMPSTMNFDNVDEWFGPTTDVLR